MTKQTLVVCILTACSFNLLAQSELNIGKFKIKKFNFSYGAENDMINDMSYHYFVDQIPADQNFPLRNESFQSEDFHSGICENPNLSLGFTLVHPAWSHLEWRNNISFMKNRYDYVSYYTKEDADDSGDYVSFSGSHDEFAIESALLYRVDVLPFLKLYGGLGTNLGLSTSNNICYNAYYSIPEEDIEGIASDAGIVDEYDQIHGCFDTDALLNQRVFYEFGLGIRIAQRVELGVNVKNGIGYRAGNGAAVGTKLQSMNISAAYILK